MKTALPKIFIISGPSRVGKDAITQGLLRKPDLNLQKVITATSRPRRPDEADGRHYYFFDPDTFQKKIEEGFFLEWAVLRGGKCFGTPVSEFDRIQSHSQNVIMNIDVQGAKRLAQMRDDLVRIFIKPDKSAHLRRRMKEANFTPDQIKARLADMKREMKEMTAYDYVVVNREGRLQEAIDEVAAIIKQEISK